MKSKAKREELLDWEPELGMREWYTHRGSGDRGYLVRREGKDMIRLDRPSDPHAVRPMSSDWLRDEGWRPITVHQRAQVAFEADRALCRALGVHEETKKNWNELSDSARIRWTTTGPLDEPRAGLWSAIMDELRDLAR